jgi:manganese-dependent ADP-ribose/CDP-alcohol diphosphatase
VKRRVFIFAVLTLLALLNLGAEQAGERRVFSFGIVADIQYADKEVSGRRRYSEALGKLERCVVDWNSRELAFTIQLGDIIDGNHTLAATLKDLDSVLDVLNRLNKKIYHVIGNHCLTVNRGLLLDKLGLQNAYYDFSHSGWSFIVLDGMDISIHGWPEDSENYRRAKAYLAANPDAASYNGAISEAQITWLKERLEHASKAAERVIIFCHHPILEEASSESLLLWNHRETIKLLENYGCIAAFVSGHDHSGGYAFRNGIHHLTMPGMVESPAGGNAYGIVDVYNDRLVLNGVGTVKSATLELDSN